jgi:hypothetical protein
MVAVTLSCCCVADVGATTRLVSARDFFIYVEGNERARRKGLLVVQHVYLKHFAGPPGAPVPPKRSFASSFLLLMLHSKHLREKRFENTHQRRENGRFDEELDFRQFWWIYTE